MAGEQLGMVALLHDLPVVDVADLIRILDRGQAVRDDEARASLEQMVQTGLQRLLGTRVDIRRGLIPVVVGAFMQEAIDVVSILWALTALLDRE